MEKKHTRGSFTGSIGFVLAAAGSAVGLGNIWRFPYLAAKDGGGTFILVYIVLALTFGFTLLTTDIAIGRKTGQSPLVAYGKIHPGWNGLGLLASIVPVVILPYYCSIGGWVLKYLSVFLTGLFFLMVFLMNGDQVQLISQILPMGQLRLMALQQSNISGGQFMFSDFLWVLALCLGTYLWFRRSDLK